MRISFERRSEFLYQPFEEMKYAAESSWLQTSINRLLIGQAAKKVGLSFDQYLTQNIGTPGSRDDQSWNDAREQLAVKLRKASKIEIFLRKPTPAIVDIDLRKAILMGNNSAPIKLVVFSDFACPFCRIMAPDVTRFSKNHPSDVLVAYWQFPLKVHKGAREAAIAVFCADAQNKFLVLHDLLYEQPVLNDDTLRSAAERAGLNMQQFESCFNAPETARKVDEAVAAGEAVGIDSIPTVFMNGKLVGGTLSLDDLETLYRQEVAAAKK